MAESMPIIIVVTPVSVYLLISLVNASIKRMQLRKTAKSLLEHGVQHAMVTEDQIIF